MTTTTTTSAMTTTTTTTTITPTPSTTTTTTTTTTPTPTTITTIDQSTTTSPTPTDPITRKRSDTPHISMNYTVNSIFSIGGQSACRSTTTTTVTTDGQITSGSTNYVASQDCRRQLSVFFFFANIIINRLLSFHSYNYFFNLTSFFLKKKIMK